MNEKGTESTSSHDQLIQALTRSDLHIDQTVSRTRRNVQSTVIGLEERKQIRRKNSGLMLIVTLIFLTLLAPALWSSMNSFSSGAHFSDFQTQADLLGVMLFPGIVAAAIAGFTQQRNKHRLAGD